ncbi:MAG: tRNA (adenosine(37)-N6)-dimethylallyltransferase MiaA [Nitrospirae bacterium]|nr:MAG: tRNA (adenosine(37)-N6)-dimethylallyltransferase MiaA [Nitrospirota bacterium]
MDVIILLGPTSVGKTSLSIKIAQALDTEIISADSMQIYRGMDIGTAKPSREELSMVRHHMIDIVEPSERYSVGRYVEEVVPIIEELHRRGKIPLIVGGTGLYIKALTRGLFSAPEADQELRNELKRQEEKSPGSLYQKLKELDPEKASMINPSDRRRIIRALEVCFKTDHPISDLQRELTEPLPYRFTKIGLTRDRKELYRLIELRVDDMFRRGLVEEVRRLIEANPSETPLQAIGYKETIDYLKGKRGLEETVRLIKRATKRYAKRQFTWFRKEPDIQWVDITGMFDVDEIFKKVLSETTLKGFIAA